MVTELYLSLIYRPHPSKAARLFGRLTTRTAHEIGRREEDDLSALDDMAKLVEASLKRYGAERLPNQPRRGRQAYV